MDLALHPNGVRAAVSGKYTEAENWKQPGALAGSLVPACWYRRVRPRLFCRMGLLLPLELFSR